MTSQIKPGPLAITRHSHLREKPLGARTVMTPGVQWEDHSCLCTTCNIMATSVLAETSVAENSLMKPGRRPFLPGVKPGGAKSRLPPLGRPLHPFDPSNRQRTTPLAAFMAGVDEHTSSTSPSISQEKTTRRLGVDDNSFEEDELAFPNLPWIPT